MQSPPNPADAAPTLSVNKTVFLASSLVSILLIVFTILFPQASEAVLGNALRWVSDHFGWYYMLVVAAYSLFALYVGLSRYGDIKLGQDHDKPDFPFLTWAAMWWWPSRPKTLTYQSRSFRPKTHLIAATLPNRALRRT